MMLSMGERREEVEARERVELDLLREGRSEEEPRNPLLGRVGVAWGVSWEQVVSREELETESGLEERREVLLPSLREEMWSVAETREKVEVRPGAVTFLALVTRGEVVGREGGAALRVRGESEGRLEDIFSMRVSSSPSSSIPPLS